MQNFSIHPKEMLFSIYRNRQLIVILSKREIVARYRGSVLGLLWAILNPLFLLLVYTFVFSVVFQTRWGGESDSRTEFAMVLFAGLITFNIFSECLNRAPTIITNNVSYVKKVVFPLEILPLVSLLAALFQTFISLMVWALVYVLTLGVPKPTILLFPVVILPLIFFALTTGWLFSSLAVYFRDISQLIGLFTTVALFSTPIFYPLEAIPEKYRTFIYLNPLAIIVAQVREVMYYGRIPDWRLWLIALLGNLLLCWLGFAWFQKIRKGFADVI